MDRMLTYLAGSRPDAVIKLERVGRISREDRESVRNFLEGEPAGIESLNISLYVQSEPVPSPEVCRLTGHNRHFGAVMIVDE
jgi:hypothetical protein